MLKYLAIPQYDDADRMHARISELSQAIHQKMREQKMGEVLELEKELNEQVRKLF
jgi:hypothetical protein